MQFILFLLLTFYPDQNMHITLTNLTVAKGSIYLAVYDSGDGFLKTDKVFAQKVVPVSSVGSLHIELPTLPRGTYAVSCFHDVNGNGKLDTNLLGIPTEPYGFSNNARPKFRAPRWEEARFMVEDAGTAISIKLEKW